MQPSLVLGSVFAALLPGLAGAQGDHWRQLPPSGAFTTKILAWDDGRGRMVMIESSADANTFRTWERVGDHWSLRHTPVSPPPRDNFAAAYDPVRRRVVLFGGSVLYQPQAPGAMLADTWEYDGDTWVQRVLPNNPPPMTQSWLGFDYATGKLLLRSGLMQTGGAGYAGLFDGTTWTAVATPPFSAWAATFASDPVQHRIVALAGTQTAIWNGAAWNVVTPPQSPPLTYGGALVFDGALGALVFLMGYDASTASTLNTVRWSWNGTTWQQLGGPPTPTRVGASVAYDPRRNLTFAIDGYATALWTARFPETLVWDGTTWSTTGETFQPFQVTACFDTQANRLVAYDEQGTGAEWDGRAWSARASIPVVGSSTTAVAIAWDDARQRLVAVRGGYTFEWTGTAWTAPVPVPFPPSRTLVYHAGVQRVMAATPGGLWEWDGATWSLVHPSGGSIDSAGRNLVYDPSTNRLFTSSITSVSTWDGSSWTQQTPTVIPSPPWRLDVTLGFDPVAQQVVLFGGWELIGQPPVQHDDLWGWNGANWVPRLASPRPSPRGGAAMVTVPGLGPVLVSGFAHEFNGAYSVFGDVWALNPSAGDVVQLGGGCGGANGAPLFVASSPVPNTLAFTLELTSAAPSAPAFFGIAGSPAAIALGAGCTLWLQPPVPLLPVATDAAGQTLLALPIPPVLVGFTFATQAAVLDATAPLGVSLSRGLQLTIGW